MRGGGGEGIMDCGRQYSRKGGRFPSGENEEIALSSWWDFRQGFFGFFVMSIV